MKPLIIYHRHCTDGFCAAWVAAHALGGECELHAAQYGDAPPDVSGRRVWIVDFSYPRPVLDEMVAKCDYLLVLDHHATAEADLKGHPHAKFDGSESGASLTWKHFHPGESVPLLVQYVRDRDLWKWELPDSREVSEVVRLAEFTLDAWDQLAYEVSTRLRSVVEKGRALRQATNKRVESASAHPVTVRIAGVEFDVTNATTDFSEVAGALSKRTGAGAAYFHRADGKVQFSLRSEGGTVDVSEVAKRYGGGGNRSSAGFAVSLQGFLGLMGGANERQTGNAYQWCCVRCGGGTTELWCSDCGAWSSSVCVPGWFGEGVAAEYSNRWKDGYAQALRKVEAAFEEDVRRAHSPKVWDVIKGVKP